jgi:hypothetical protein
MGEQDATSKPVSLHSGPQIARLSGRDDMLFARVGRHREGLFEIG